MTRLNGQHGAVAARTIYLDNIAPSGGQLRFEPAQQANDWISRAATYQVRFFGDRNPDGTHKLPAAPAAVPALNGAGNLILGAAGIGTFARFGQYNIHFWDSNGLECAVARIVHKEVALTGYPSYRLRNNPLPANFNVGHDNVYLRQQFGGPGLYRVSMPLPITKQPVYYRKPASLTANSQTGYVEVDINAFAGGTGSTASRMYVCWWFLGPTSPMNPPAGWTAVTPKETQGNLQFRLLVRHGPDPVPPHNSRITVDAGVVGDHRLLMMDNYWAMDEPLWSAPIVTKGNGTSTTVSIDSASVHQGQEFQEHFVTTVLGTAVPQSSSMWITGDLHPYFELNAPGGQLIRGTSDVLSKGEPRSANYSMPEGGDWIAVAWADRVASNYAGAYAAAKANIEVSENMYVAYGDGYRRRRTQIAFGNGTLGWEPVITKLLLDLADDGYTGFSVSGENERVYADPNDPAINGVADAVALANATNPAVNATVAAIGLVNHGKLGLWNALDYFARNGGFSPDGGPVDVCELHGYNTRVHDMIWGLYVLRRHRALWEELGLWGVVPNEVSEFGPYSSWWGRGDLTGAGPGIMWMSDASVNFIQEMIQREYIIGCEPEQVNHYTDMTGGEPNVTTDQASDCGPYPGYALLGAYLELMRNRKAGPELNFGEAQDVILWGGTSTGRLDIPGDTSRVAVIFNNGFSTDELRCYVSEETTVRDHFRNVTATVGPGEFFIRPWSLPIYIDVPHGASFSVTPPPLGKGLMKHYRHKIKVTDSTGEITDQKYLRRMFAGGYRTGWWDESDNYANGGHLQAQQYLDQWNGILIEGSKGFVCELPSPATVNRIEFWFTPKYFNWDGTPLDLTVRTKDVGGTWTVRRLHATVQDSMVFRNLPEDAKTEGYSFLTWFHHADIPDEAGPIVAFEILVGSSTRGGGTNATEFSHMGSNVLSDFPMASILRNVELRRTQPTAVIAG